MLQLRYKIDNITVTRNEDIEERIGAIEDKIRKTRKLKRRWKKYLFRAQDRVRELRDSIK